MTDSKTLSLAANIKEIQNLEDVPENFESQEAAEDFWDEHALSLDALRELPEELELDAIFKESRKVAHTIVVEANLYQKIRSQAYAQGISTETLANLWLGEHLEQVVHQKK